MDYKILKFQTGKADQYGNISYWCEVENITDGKVVVKKTHKSEPPAIGEVISGNLIKSSYQKDGKDVIYYRFEKEKTQFQKPSRPQVNLSSFALSYAKDLAVAGKIQLSEITDYSNKFLNWLKNNSND